MRNSLFLLLLCFSYSCIAQDSTKFINRRNKQIAELDADTNYMRRFNSLDGNTLEYFLKGKIKTQGTSLYSALGRGTILETEMDLIKVKETKITITDSVITEYYFENEDLIYVSQHSFPMANNNTVKTYQLFEGKYYFRKRRLLFAEETGSNNFPDQNKQSIQKQFVETGKKIVKIQPKIFLRGQPI